MVKQVLLNSLPPVCPEIHSPAFCCSVLCRRELVLSSCTSHTPLPTGSQPRGVGGEMAGTWGRLEDREREEARVLLPLSDWMVSLASPLWFQLPLSFQNSSSTLLPCFQIPLGGSKSWVSVILSYLLKAGVFLCPQSLGVAHDFSHALSVTPKPF